MSGDRDRGQRYRCSSCKKTHDNYHSHVAHKLCTECRDKALDETRKTGLCCRCTTVQVKPLTPANAVPADRDRFLACPTCALVLSRDANDRVRGALGHLLPEARGGAP